MKAKDFFEKEWGSSFKEAILYEETGLFKLSINDIYETMEKYAEYKKKSDVWSYGPQGSLIDKIFQRKNKCHPVNKSGYRKYPWSEMSVGDYFLVRANDSKDRIKKQSASLCSGLNWALRNNPKIKFRSESKDKIVKITRVK